MDVRNKLIKIENWWLKRVAPIIDTILDYSPISFSVDTRWQFNFSSSEVPRVLYLNIYLRWIHANVDLYIPRFICDFMKVIAYRISYWKKIPCLQRSLLTGRCIHKTWKPIRMPSPNGGLSLHSGKWEMRHTTRSCDNCITDRSASIFYKFLDMTQSMGVLSENWVTREAVTDKLWEVLRAKHPQTETEEI